MADFVYTHERALLGGENVPDTEKNSEIPLGVAEKQLIEMIRALNFGEIRVIVQDGKPARVEEIKKSIILGEG